MTDLAPVNEWTARLWALTGDVELSAHQTPTNSDRIRAAALFAAEGRSTAPVTPEYLPVPPGHVNRLQAMADGIAGLDDPLLDLLEASLATTLAFARALSERSSDAITAYGLAEYGAPTAPLVARAEQVLDEPDDPKGGTGQGEVVDAATVAGLVDRVLASLGILDWTTVVREHMSARMAVAASAREVRIRADASFTPTQLRGLVVHEVGTHVLRADEGSQQSLHLLARGLPGYLETEEGLATHHEAQVDHRPERLRTFALRVLAADTAMRGGLADVMHRLITYVTPDQAFPIALRAKRGMADLTQPGSPMKDVVYLRGLLSVGDHLAAHPEDHSLLMAGKLGLAHLPVARSLAEEGMLTIPEDRVQQLIEEARSPYPPWDR